MQVESGRNLVAIGFLNGRSEIVAQANVYCEIPADAPVVVDVQFILVLQIGAVNGDTDA